MFYRLWLLEKEWPLLANVFENAWPTGNVALLGDVALFEWVGPYWSRCDLVRGSLSMWGRL